MSITSSIFDDVYCMEDLCVEHCLCGGDNRSKIRGDEFYHCLGGSFGIL